MTIDIEKLAEEHLTPFARTGWTAYGEQLKQFADAYAAKVLEDKEREIAELKAKVRDIHAKAVDVYVPQITELQAHINDLREDLEDISKEPYKDQSDLNTIRKVIEIAKHSLSKTPAQSLQEHDNEVIEMCANDLDRQGFNHAAEAIRAMKGK